MTLEPSRCWAVLPAAGIGSRMGSDIPKQYLEVAGVTLLEHSLRALLDCPDIAGVVVPLHPHDNRAASLAILSEPRVQTVSGGAQRSDSVLAGLEALAERVLATDWVLVHDAARPCLAPEDIQRLITRVRERGIGGLLAQPIVDTVKRADDEALVAATLERSALWRAQTPQMFALGELRQALRRAVQQGEVITDEASAMESSDYPVQLVEGSPGNLKVTVPADLELAAWYLDRQRKTGRM